MKNKYSLSKEDSEKMLYIDSELKNLKDQGRMRKITSLATFIGGVTVLYAAEVSSSDVSNMLNLCGGIGIMMGLGNFITDYSSKSGKSRRQRIRELKQLKSELENQNIYNNTYYKKR